MWMKLARCSRKLRLSVTHSLKSFQPQPISQSQQHSTSRYQNLYSWCRALPQFTPQHKTQWVKTTNIISLVLWWEIQPWHSWVLWLKVSTWLQLKVSAGAAAQGWTRGTSFKVTHVAGESPGVFVSCWPKTSVPCCTVLSTGLLPPWHFASLQASEGSEGERECERACKVDVSLLAT